MKHAAQEVKMDDIALSKELAYALRHAPQKYGLKPDREGFVSADDLLRALNKSGKYDRQVVLDDLLRISSEDEKQRYEIRNGMIRAQYGHSFAVRIDHPRIMPPAVLYHGTSRRALDAILSEGLKPMQRQFVHLSADIQTALLTGRRHDASPVLLRVDAAAAARDGFPFYQGAEKIILADFIPAYYLSIEEKTGK